MDGTDLILRATEFILGMVLARIVLNRRWIGLRPMAAAILLVAARNPRAGRR